MAIFVLAFLRQRTKLWSHPQGDRVNGEKLHSPFLHWPGDRYSPDISKHISWLLKSKIKKTLDSQPKKYVDFNTILTTCTH